MIRVLKHAGVLAVAAFLQVLAVAPAPAQSVEEFYKGKNLSLIIPNAPGGSFDLYARLVAAHLGQFLPGHPSIIPQNMPGAAGMQAANYLADLALKDGSVLAVLVPNITLAQVLGVQAITYDVRKLNWIGRAVATTATLFTWQTSQTKTLADLRQRETLVASTGPLSQAEIDSLCSTAWSEPGSSSCAATGAAPKPRSRSSAARPTAR